MDGITGFSPEEAKSNIYSFQTASDDVYSAYISANKNLFDDLYYTWCSTNAVDFYLRFSSVIEETATMLVNSLTAIVTNAERAYNIIAREHGWENMSSLSDEYHPYATGEVSIELKELRKINESGVVGMNIKLVQMSLDIYAKHMNEVITDIDNLPMNIAFYDPEGAQMTAYKETISKVKERITLELDVIDKEIKSAMETETDNIMLAKQQSTQILNA